LAAFGQQILATLVEIQVSPSPTFQFSFTTVAVYSTDSLKMVVDLPKTLNLNHLFLKLKGSICNHQLDFSPFVVWQLVQMNVG
jgi:hypothetical protein